MMNLFKKNKKETVKNETYTLILTKNGITETKTVDKGYLRFFVEEGLDLEYDTVEVR